MFRELGSVVKATAFFHLSDQWVLDAGLKHQTDFPGEHPAGHLQAVGHVRYFVDVLQIVPSLYLGVGAGRMLARDVPVFSLEYGVSADYMFSRKFQVGISFGGITTTFGEGLTGPDGEYVTSRTRMLLLLRLQWVFGETW